MKSPTCNQADQALAGDHPKHHQQRHLEVGDRAAQAVQIEQQPQMDEKDGDEQRSSNEDHLLLRLALRQDRIHGKSSQKCTHDLFNPGDFSAQ